MFPKLQTMKTPIQEAVRRHRAHSVRIFGSALHSDSPHDVDILVDMAKDASLLDEIALQEELTELLQMKVDLVTVQGLSPFIRDEILNTATPL